MSLRSDGSYRCDRCGAKLENGGVHEAAIVSDLDLEQPGTVRVLHLCRAPRVGAPRGCVGNVLGTAALTDYNEARN